MVQLNSHLDKYRTLDSYSPLPPGEYHVGIMASELKNTRSGGSMLSFTYEVMDGDYQGSRVWDNLNLWHNNPKTVEIAMRQLKSIATASGYPNPNYIPDSSELHGLEMKVKLAIRRDGDGNEYQDIKAYLPLNAASSAASAVGTAASLAPSAGTQPASASRNVPPVPRSAASVPWE